MLDKRPTSENLNWEHFELGEDILQAAFDLECHKFTRGELSENYGEMELSFRLVINPAVGKLPNRNCSLALRRACPLEGMGKVHWVVRCWLSNAWEPRVVDAALPEASVSGIRLH
jgi:hypothetical protein